MSDTNSNSSGFLGLGQPLIKLFETIACGIGKLYEPIHIKRMAKAKAKEIEIISDSFCKNIDLPIVYTDGAISINTQDANDLVLRAQNRLCFQELRKQQNIEAVVLNAYNDLKNEVSVSDIPVDIDWISEFFNDVANISSEQMQQIWGRLLAGEIKQPGSFSLRTLETLKKLSQKEARIFEEVSPYILSCRGDQAESYFDFFLLENMNGSLLSQYGILFNKIMILSEAGILSENNQISFVLDVRPNDSALIKGLYKAIEIKNLENEVIRVSHFVYLLTESGKELLPIVLNCKGKKEKADAYLRDCLEELKSGTATMINSEIVKRAGHQILWKIIDSK